MSFSELDSQIVESVIHSKLISTDERDTFLRVIGSKRTEKLIFTQNLISRVGVLVPYSTGCHRVLVIVRSKKRVKEMQQLAYIDIVRVLQQMLNIQDSPNNRYRMTGAMKIATKATILCLI